MQIYFSSPGAALKPAWKPIGSKTADFTWTARKHFKTFRHKLAEALALYDTIAQLKAKGCKAGNESRFKHQCNKICGICQLLYVSLNFFDQVFSTRSIQLFYSLRFNILEVTTVSYSLCAGMGAFLVAAGSFVS